jgi:putative phosphoesterase
MVRAAILADTHLPRGRRALPPECIARLQAADLIFHAGDLSQEDVLIELRAYGDVAAVHGNVDSYELRDILPARLELDVEGVRIGMVHDAGRAQGRLERLRREFPGCDAVIFGHSHIPLLERAEDGFQIFNPGSPTDRRRQPRHTMGLGKVDGDRIGFELLELD